MTKKKIELEDLWKIMPVKSKFITIFYLVLFIGASPFIQSNNFKTENNINVIKKTGTSGTITTLDNVKELNEEPIVHKSIQVSSSGFCFSAIVDESHGKIQCPISKTFGVINKISEYSIKDGKIDNAYYFYEPVKTAQYGIALVLWLFLIVVPVYIHTIKNADLSQLKERTGKRKLFNFKD